VAQNDEESTFLADLEAKAKRLGVPLHFIPEATRLVPHTTSQPAIPHGGGAQ
jgi:hypothetical protein